MGADEAQAREQDVTQLQALPGPSNSEPGNHVQTLLTDAARPRRSNDNIPPPPNGGYGWVCTACVAFINANSWGINSTYGVFLASYLANNTFPGASHLDYAFVGGLSIGVPLLISPLATISIRELGTKPTMLAGALLQSLSLILASLATETYELFLTQGVLFGIGMGLLFVPSYSIIPQWFTTRRSLANGLSTAGSGLGGLLWSLATGAMIRNLGLQWAFRILCIATFIVNVSCTLLIKDRNKAIGSVHLAFDTTLIKRMEYLVVLAFGCFSVLGYIVLVYSLANYANEVGLSSSQASVISALFNLGQAIGRPFVGYFSDYIGRINMAMIATFACGVLSLAIWINAKTYGVLIFYAIIGGSVAGTIWVTIAPVMAEVVGLRLMPSGLNLFWLALVLPATFSEPIALVMVSDTGSYLGTQVLTGLMYIVAALFLVVLRGWKIGEDALAEAGIDEAGDGEDGRKKLTFGQQLYNCMRWENV